LYPFPRRRVESLLSQYHRAEDVIWLQEEPKNRGAWLHAAGYLREIVKPQAALVYAGKPARPSPSVGSSALHKLQQQEIILAALHGTGKTTASTQEV
ncbi:MAG: hypothetical protein ACRDIB_19490, partial [Ardenticatenaceae bacterium]